MTMEDTSRAASEVGKKNTDCIYFLASPLTCKKGNECEFRHLEGARVNPRDCWYWLNGNCLNPKCLFRHPPLEGLLGNPKSTSSQTPDQASATAHTSSSKQKTPCFYFQKGSCLKGDRCPFSHVPDAIKNPNPPQLTEKAAPALELQNPLKPAQSKPKGEASWQPQRIPTRAPVHQKIPDANGSVQKSKKADERLKESSSVRESFNSGGDGVNDRRENRKEIGHGEIGGSDLRLRLLKKRKGDGDGEDFRSSRRENDEDRLRRRHNSSEKDHVLPRGSSLSSRLRGRISLPGTSSSDFQRDEDRGKDRISRRIQTAELQPRLNLALNHNQSQDSAYFEGPKSLSEILKRKREAAAERSDGDEIKLKLKVSEGLPKMEKIDREEDEEEEEEEEEEEGEEEQQQQEGAIEEGELAPETEDNSRRDGEWEYEGGEELPQPESSSPGEEIPEAEDGFREEDMEETEHTGEFGEDEVDDEDGDDFARKIGIIFS